MTDSAATVASDRATLDELLVVLMAKLLSYRLAVDSLKYLAEVVMMMFSQPIIFQIIQSYKCT